MSALPNPRTTADTLLQPWDAPPHQDLFVERYGRLRGWALRLSRGDHGEADDLLHNAFLQFVLRRRELAEIDNLEGYLFGLLRRLRMSSARTALNRRQEPLSVVDYDAATRCLTDTDAHGPLQRIQVAQELGAVCEYACRRKDSSKAGSVLILRFFHGYYPKEIARILRSPLRLANDWLRIARREARAFLLRPSAPAMRTIPGADAIGDTTSAADLLHALRARIHAAKTGACLTLPAIARLYDADAKSSVPSATLSHIVSCPACLQLVATHLHLGPYAERDPRDMLGPDDGWRTSDDPPQSSSRGRLILGAAIATALAVWALMPWRGATASASELLRSAGSAEGALLAAPDIVVHRVLTFEERRPPARAVVRRRRIEVWHDGTHGVAVRRLYEGEKVAAAEWTRADGSRTLYRPGAGATPVTPRAMDADPEAIWRWEPSAGHFAALLNPAMSTTVENRRTDYVLHARREPDAPGLPGLVEATLTIQKADRRAVAQTLLVRSEGGVREFSFTETALAAVPASTVPAAAFEPDPELTGRHLTFDAPITLPVERERPPPAPAIAIHERNRLEFDALFARHRLERGSSPSDDGPDSAWVLERSAAALTEAHEIERLAVSWPPTRLQALDSDRAARWLDVARDHARRFRRESEQLRQRLRVFTVEPSGSSGDAPAATPPDLSSILEAPHIAARLAALAVSHDTAVRQLFDPAFDEPGTPIDVAALVRSLHDAELQAAWFDAPLSLPPSERRAP